MNYLKPFNGADPTPILDALKRDCSPDQIVSVMYRAEIYPFRSIDEREQWRRLIGIIGCASVYEAFGISSLPLDPPATFHYSTGLETIGTIGNLLLRGGIHAKFVEDHDTAISIARTFLDSAVIGRYNYGTVEAYSCRDPWCDWFIGEQMLDETIVFGHRGDWWVLAVTGTDQFTESTHNNAMHPSRRSVPILLHSFLAATG